MKCYSCSTENNLNEGKVFRSDVCSNCRQDLRCCRNCEFYDSSAQWECREHISELVKDKERANYCDFFRPTQSQSLKEDNKSQALSAAEKLFKKF